MTGTTAPAAHAAAALTGQPTAQVITGRTFAGARFSSTAQRTDLLLIADRGFAWSETATDVTDLDGLPAGSIPPAAPATVHRLYLQGDVGIEVAGQRFTAAQAVVWMQNLAEWPDDAALPGTIGQSARRVTQLAIYFDRVSDPGAEAGVAVAADRLLVTATIDGAVTLRADVLSRGRPAVDTPSAAGAQSASPTLLVDAERAMARHLRRLAGDEASDSPDRPRGVGSRREDRASLGVPGLSAPFEPGSGLPGGVEPLVDDAMLPPAEGNEPIFAEDGLITFAVGTSRATPPAGDSPPGSAHEATDDAAAPIRLISDPDAGENTLLLSGGVSVMYSQQSTGRTLEVTAQRAVVFLEPGPLSKLAEFTPRQVRGMYLEGDVIATDGRLNLRGPKVYYDVRNNQATIIDAVFWTHDERLNLPVYVRAAAIRQLNQRQFRAERATFATTSFFDPVFSLGAREVTITQSRRAVPKDVIGTRGGLLGLLTSDGSLLAEPGAGPVGDGYGGATSGYTQVNTTEVDARGLTLRAGGLPIFPLPRFTGRLDNFPLRDVRIENANGSGPAVKTEWDLFATLGAESPPGLNAQFIYDQFFDRGPALGLASDWSGPDPNRGNDGRLFLYTVPIDFGRDSLATGAKIGRDFEFRSLLFGENRLTISDNWTLFLEGSYFSDENVVDAFFRPLAQTAREFTNAAYLRRNDDHSSLSFLVKGELNDFTPNQYLLQSQGYNTDKLPEVFYARLNDDVLRAFEPGALAWSHEHRLSRLQLNFTEPTLRELGFDTLARSQAAFGLTPDESLGDALRARGLSESDVLRFDTRQELTTQVDFGPLRFAPFASGRFTAYDESFEQFSPDADDPYRAWYSTGLRGSTQITRVDDDADSTLLDLHRVRHILEPNFTAWYAGSTLGQNDLPVYDDRVESLATGAAGRIGLTQTWQTQRGGPGRWRNVDWLIVRTDFATSSQDADRESPIPRFFNFRPEYSLLGEHFDAEAAWQVTDAISLSASHIYDFQIDQPSRTSAGGLFTITPSFNAYSEMRYINAFDSTFVDFGVTYQLTRRYQLAAAATYDTDEKDFQSVSGSIRRRVPEADIGFSLGYNNITDETSFSFIFEPVAARRDPLERLRGLAR